MFKYRFFLVDNTNFILYNRCALVEVILLKWNLSWLMKQKNGEFTFSEDLVFPHETLRNIHSLLGLENVHIEGTGKLDSTNERLYVQLKISGTMILSCAVSLEEVPYPFETESTEVFSFVKVSPDEDYHEVKRNTVDITPIVFQNIVMEVPTRIVKEGATMKTEGKGWKVVSGQDEDEEIPIDPRLAKLKDFFKESN